MKNKEKEAFPADNELQSVPDGGRIALSEEDLCMVSGGSALPGNDYGLSSGGYNSVPGTASGRNITEVTKPVPVEETAPITAPVIIKISSGGCGDNPFGGL